MGVTSPGDWARKNKATPPPRKLTSVDPAEVAFSEGERFMRDRVMTFIESGTFEPPPLPAIAHDILQACVGGSAGAGNLAEIAHRDSFIAGRILKLANSAYFQLGHPADTLRAAIVRIGQNELRNLVMTIVLGGETFSIPEAKQFATISWRHSLACALAASLLAGQTGWCEPHRAFLAGLLHDVGKAVVLHAYAQLRKLHPDDAPPLGLAVDIAQALHADVGGIISRNWKLDDGLDEIIRLHHQPVRAELEPRTCQLVAFADAVTSEVGASDEPMLPDITTHPIGLAMGIDHPALLELLDRVLQLMAHYEV